MNAINVKITGTQAVVSRLHRATAGTANFGKSVIPILVKTARQRVIEQIYDIGNHGKLSRKKSNVSKGHSTPIPFRRMLHSSAKPGTGRVWLENQGPTDLVSIIETTGAKPHFIEGAFGRKSKGVIQLHDRKGKKLGMAEFSEGVWHPGMRPLHPFRNGMRVFMDQDYNRILKGEFDKHLKR